MKISVKVKTGAREEKVEELGNDTFFVSVKERPEKGKANRAVVKALAAYFNISQEKIKIISGRSARRKVVKIE